MSTLKTFLGKYADPSIVAGDSELSNKQIEEITNYLTRRKRNNFYILAGCLILIIVGLIYIIFISSNSEKLEKAIGKSGVVGISIAGIFTFILNLWKEINYIRLLSIFVNSIDPASLKSIITEMWKKI